MILRELGIGSQTPGQQHATSSSGVLCGLAFATS
jgi:hypothetical protein